MKAEFDFILKVKVVHECAENDIDELVDPYKYALQGGMLICDEATTCDGVATFEVHECGLKVSDGENIVKYDRKLIKRGNTNNINETIYNDFMKKA